MKNIRAIIIVLAFACIAEAQTTVVCCGGGGGGGTVSSVAATVPSFMNVTGSPITAAGTLAFSFTTELQNLIFAAPCGSTGAPTFRALCAADIPALAPTAITGTAVVTADARLSDARTPTAHASTHAAAGSDPVTLTEAQITGLVTDLASKQNAGLPQNSKSAAYTTVLGDANGHIYHPSADTSARTWTIDSNTNVPYPTGTMLTFVNDCSAGTITLAITSDTLILAGTGSTGSRTLAACGMATALKVSSVRWIISGSGLS